MGDDSVLDCTGRKAVQGRLDGRVQGVCFRDFFTRLARQMEIDGWVRNRSDGTLEFLAAGPEGVLDNFLYQCVQVGPPGARVDNFELFVTDPPEVKGFIRLPTL